LQSDVVRILPGEVGNRGEFTDAALEEMKLFMLFYCGAPNTSALAEGISRAKKRVADAGA